MNVLMINVSCGVGSTGRICIDLAAEFEKNGDNVKIAYGRDDVLKQYKKYAVRIGSDLDVRLHGIYTRLTDRHGFASKNATKKFLKWADEYNPDLLWLHNIHGYYINIEMLFEWIKSRPNMQVKWTLHDCWAFTGHCSYFAMVKCEQWKTHCSYCVQKSRYPKSFVVDNCRQNFERKRAAFCGVKNMTLITPSKWLADLVKESFLKEYPIEVVYNEIDRNVFKPTPSDFREKYGLTDKKVVLGVASVWDERKGLQDFFKLREKLDESYAIVIVGLSKKQLKDLPKNIIGISRTNNAKELAEIYTAADVFVNPTYEDNYPTVNLEAQACGTMVITYDTGGSPESVNKEFVVKTGNMEKIAALINNIT